ncbi:MAG: hypothetical protein K2N18_04645, partial [Clostridia bacterium]|nr:hypothetical protein [Clostridia bacterium]
YKHYWRFKLFNKSFDLDVIKDLTDRLKGIMGKLDSSAVRDYIYNAPKNIEQIADIYKSVFGRKNPHGLSGGLNITSAILVHYPIYPETIQKIICSTTFKEQSLNWVYTQSYGASTVSVLTGDAINFAEYPEFINFANGVDIFCLQVPHHGGKKNWDSLKKSRFPLYRDTHYVLPFGLGNTYGHPNTSVLEDLDHGKMNYFCVTQYSTFEYEIVAEVSIQWKIERLV